MKCFGGDFKRFEAAIAPLTNSETLKKEVIFKGQNGSLKLRIIRPLTSPNPTPCSLLNSHLGFV